MDLPLPRSRLSLWLDLIRWDRPAGWLLLLWPTLSALWIAAGGFPGWHLLLVFVAGTILMRSAGCAANDVADREFDRHVKRTAARPVTSGLVAPAEALALGAALALLAFVLVLTTNGAAVAWSDPDGGIGREAAPGGVGQVADLPVECRSPPVHLQVVVGRPGDKSFGTGRQERGGSPSDTGG